MVDAALIELEGVLFDTRDMRRESLRAALREHGLSAELEADEADAMPARAAAEIVLTNAGIPHDDVLLDLVALSAERAFTSKLSATGAALQDGARDFVREAAARMRLAVVARSRRADVDAMLRLSGLGDFFTMAICADDVFEAKPSPAGHTLALERLGRQRTIALRNVIALEDGLAGIRAARRSGVRCIAVGAVPAFEAMEAHAYISSVARQTARSLDLIAHVGQERVQ